jgi:hypothetical protein
LATGAGLVTAVTLWLIVPSFVSGPFGDVPPALWDAWLSRVAELQPLWPFGANPARTVYLLTAPLIGVALAWRAGVLDQGFRAVWWGLAATIAGLVALGVAQARFTAFSQLLATVAWGWLAAILWHEWHTGEDSWLVASRRIDVLAGVAGFLVPVILLAAARRFQCVRSGDRR